jgi:hypothetical protein
MKEREIVASHLQRSSYTQRLVPVGRLTATVCGLPTSGVCAIVQFPVHGKNTYYERKEEKMGQINNTMKTNSKRRKNLRLATVHWPPYYD